MTQALLGGGFLRTGHFFDNLKGNTSDPAVIRDAWLQAAINGYKGGGGPMHRATGESAPINERVFRAVDPDGQEWLTEAGKIKRGPTPFADRATDS